MFKKIYLYTLFATLFLLASCEKPLRLSNTIWSTTNNSARIVFEEKDNVFRFDSGNKVITGKYTFSKDSKSVSLDFGNRLHIGEFYTDYSSNRYYLSTDITDINDKNSRIGLCFYEK